MSKDEAITTLENIAKLRQREIIRLNKMLSSIIAEIKIIMDGKTTQKNISDATKRLKEIIKEYEEYKK